MFFFRTNCPSVMLNITTPFIFFGYKYQIEQFVRSQNFTENFEEFNALFVPLDGSVPTDLPDKSYVIIPPHEPASNIYKKPENILPTPLLFNVANPILTYTKNIEEFITENCNETLYKVNCLRNKFNRKYRSVLMTPSSITDILKIEPLKENFVYNIFRIENVTVNLTEVIKRNSLFKPYAKIFSYSIFNDKLNPTDQYLETSIRNTSSQEYVEKCINHFLDRNFRYVLSNETMDVLYFRSESWVFAFLSLSLLGVLFCISILIFLLISIFKRDILEGNPILTLALLLGVMLLFCAVLPFSLEYNKYTKHYLCLARYLAVTLGYATVFSLLLSRCILLATASKEIGFMSHIAGPVQAFLCLFIFGVQAALSIQIIGRCLDMFRGHSFVFLMSYNTMLLLLMLCLCPLIYKCQRNYREGKYFTIAIILITCIWGIWLPCYAFLDENWKEPMLCLGLVSTAGIFLGAIFIPRTYLMTIAAARDKITSTLPSLATAASTMDIYRANTQPIYDCVNVAAINAVTVARAGVATTIPSMQQPDLYSCPALPDDDDFNFRCDTPPSTDKVTRF
ncbi:hypothetical protein NQ314_019165 [Rhamnusium bicolor]|uniref:G-protein coupled receptors family 3 profile domain-containing protein n=1 Tax=Rhamnusium bicolor TaxID=1586634 RepID=A0AAV8WP39_9CUCU|nr:hypothetical protein NQ314_019165 [Rhamnusium bicolor]